MPTPPAYYANLVGVNFRPRETRELIHSFLPGTVVQLERDYENGYDDFAIRVLYKGTFLSYLERSMTKVLGPMMDEGQDMSAMLFSKTADRRTPWLVEVKLTGERNELWAANAKQRLEYKERYHQSQRDAFRQSIDDDEIPF